MSRERIDFDCNDCPAFCCGIYEHIQVKPHDLRRLAKYFGLSEEETARRHTKVVFEERTLRRKKDPLLDGTVCKFLDLKTRGCSIYEARPTICRQYPGMPRCGYYDVYRFEQAQQGDPEILPIFKLVFRKHRPDPEEPSEPPKKKVKKAKKGKKAG